MTDEHRDIINAMRKMTDAMYDVRDLLFADPVAHAIMDKLTTVNIAELSTKFSVITQELEDEFDSVDGEK
jgi:hypothetical protein